MRVDGALIACCDNTTATYDLVSRRKTPAVFLDRVPLGANAIRISTDNFKAGWVSTKHLVDPGHERIAVVAGRIELSPHAHRVEGFRKTMREAGLPVLDEYFRTDIRYHRKPATRLGNNCWNCRSARPRSFAQTTRPSSDWCAP